MDKDNLSQIEQEDQKGDANNSQPDLEVASSTSIQIHGGCGLGAVTLINNEPTIHNGTRPKTKDEGKLKKGRYNYTTEQYHGQKVKISY